VMHGHINVKFRIWSACGPLCHVVVKYSDVLEEPAGFFRLTKLV